jgi:hypothetical protein
MRPAYIRLRRCYTTSPCSYIKPLHSNIRSIEFYIRSLQPYVWPSGDIQGLSRPCMCLLKSCIQSLLPYIQSRRLYISERRPYISGLDSYIRCVKMPVHSAFDRILFMHFLINTFFVSRRAVNVLVSERGKASLSLLCMSVPTTSGLRASNNKISISAAPQQPLTVTEHL